jgi:hypothetical protein
MKNFAIFSEIYSSLKPLYTVCKVFGLTPWFVKEDFVSRTISIGCNSFNTLYNMLWAMLFIVTLCYMMTDKSLEDMGVPTQKMLIVLKVYFISTYIASIVTLVHTSIYSKSMFVQLMEKISQVDYKLLNVNKKKHMNRKTKCIAITKVVNIILLIACYQMCVVFVFLKGKFEVYIIKTIECASLTCNVLTVVLFTNYVQIVTQRHKRVNNLLETFITDVKCENSNTGCCTFNQSINNRIATVPHVF